VSVLTDKARAEADEVEGTEPAEPDDEAAKDAELELEPETQTPAQAAQPQLTEQESEREFAKLEKSAATYLEKALVAATKLGIPVESCPLCTFPGLAIPRQAHEVTSDVEARVLGLIGRNVEPEYKPSQAYIRCEACDGWGDVLTGAQKDVSRTAMCVQCGGKGYVNNLQPIAPPTPTNGAGYPGAAAPYTPLVGGTPDAWNRPAGHPHWGLDPSTVGV
jgi:hypothetical protein